MTPSEVLKGVIVGGLKAGKLAFVYPVAEQMPYADWVNPDVENDVKGLLEGAGRGGP